MEPQELESQPVSSETIQEISVISGSKKLRAIILIVGGALIISAIFLFTRRQNSATPDKLTSQIPVANISDNGFLCVPLLNDRGLQTELSEADYNYTVDAHNGEYNAMIAGPNGDVFSIIDLPIDVMNEKIIEADIRGTPVGKTLQGYNIRGGEIMIVVSNDNLFKPPYQGKKDFFILSAYPLRNAAPIQGQQEATLANNADFLKMVIQNAKI